MGVVFVKGDSSEQSQSSADICVNSVVLIEQNFHLNLLSNGFHLLNRVQENFPDLFSPRLRRLFRHGFLNLHRVLQID